MHSKIAKALLIFGVILIFMGAGMTLTYGQDEESDTEDQVINPEYVGTDECRDCHRSYANDFEESFHARTLLEAEEAPELILGDFSAGEDERTIVFPGEEEARPFTIEDVFFALGVGRHVQAYVHENADGEYVVLPAQWNTVSEAWEPLSLAEAWPDPAYDFGTNCASCHTTHFDVSSLTWDENGVQCESCHGPGSQHVDFADDAGSSISDEEYANLSGAINFALDGQVCGQCHIRGENPDGIHPYPTEYQPGGDLLAEDVFQPAPTSDEAHWFPTGHAQLPNMQFNEWMLSSHPSALADAQESDAFGAACLVCHSVAQVRVNYLIEEEWVDEDDFDPLTTLERFDFGVTCASCHNPHEVESENYLRDEAYPLCTSCHYNGDENTPDGIHHPVQEMFEGVSFVEEIEPVEGVHFTAENGPTCVTCHMASVPTKNGERNSHTFHPVSPGAAAEIELLQDACTTCHTDVENPVQMQALIDSVQSNVTDRTTAAREAAGDSAPEWVSVALNVVEGDGSRGIHNYAYTNTLLSSVEAELGLVSGTVSNADVAAEVAAALPDIPVEEITTASANARRSSGLTPASMVILGIAGFIILFAAYSFFVRGSHDDGN